MTICSDDEHRAALARIDALMGARPDTPEAAELVALVDRVVAYEEVHCPIAAPSSEEAVRFRREQEEFQPEEGNDR